MKDSRFNDFPISQEIVRKCLCKLPTKCNSSPDGLPKGMPYEISTRGSNNMLILIIIRAY